MMDEYNGADEIKTGVMKGKRQNVGSNHTISIDQMRGSAIQQGDVELDSIPPQVLTSFLRYISRPSSYFQQRKREHVHFLRNTPDHRSCSGDTAKPAIN